MPINQLKKTIALYVAWISGKNKNKLDYLVVKYILLNWKKAIGAFFNDRKLASDFTTTLGPSINYVVSK